MRFLSPSCSGSRDYDILNLMPLLMFLLLLVGIGTASTSTFEKLEEKLKGIKSVKVSFLQKTKYPWHPKPEVSKGIFYATREGKFRIEYTHPDKVIIVSNGDEIVLYNEEEKEAIIDSTENNTSPVIESLFFFSKPLGEVFEPVGELRRENLKVVILKPKKKDESIKEVYLELDGKLDPVRVRVVDSEGTETSLEFLDVVKNYNPSKELFRVNLPPGVKVRRVENLR